MATSEQQSKINEFIVDLAKGCYSQEDIVEKVKTGLCDIYSDAGFRHSYSQIFATIKKEIVEEKTGNVDFLSENIGTLIAWNERPNTKWSETVEASENIRSKINKLCDHVMLEVSRISYYNNLGSKYEDINEKLKKTTTSLSIASKALKSAKQKIDFLRAESITVLSIFAAILLASLGGLNFLNSTLKSINDVSIFRLIAICCICGFVLFNTTFMLIYMAARIMDRSIHSFCSDAIEGHDCMTENKCNKDCWGINRIRKRLPYVFWVNAILIGGMVVDVIAWYIVRYTTCLR